MYNNKIALFVNNGCKPAKIIVVKFEYLPHFGKFEYMCHIASVLIYSCFPFAI